MDTNEVARLLQEAVEEEDEAKKEAILRQIPPERALEAFGILQDERQKLREQETVMDQTEQTVTMQDFDQAARDLTIGTRSLLLILAEAVEAQEARIRQLEQVREMEVGDGTVLSGH